MKIEIITIAKNSLLALGFFGILANTASAGYFDTTPAYRCDIQITRTLQVGSEGIEVTVLQNFLNRTGDLTATPNGYFGKATRAAVRAFQYDNGISTTGKVGASTRNAINERMCDTNIQTSYLEYGYSSNVTYVDPYDAFVQVITPYVTTPVIYTNPQQTVHTSGYSTYTSNVIYSPYIGYTYGITPVSGSLTISTPVANSVYNEGDTVYLAWTTSNLNASGYTILLENSSTGQSKIVTTTNRNTASFVLTKEVLDAVCAGACDNNNHRTFRIVITTPIRDIAGTVSTFRAVVAPVTIKRPYANFGTVSITTNKNPVASGDIFKLYINIPIGASWNTGLYGQYSFKIRAICPAGVTAIIAGTQCGSDFVIPFAPTYFQSEIPASITNTSWYQQNVTFVLTVINFAGQTIGTSQVNVTASQAPFRW